ncbi:MAG: PPC domain-containing protein [Planctomycetota bacterium]
MFATRLTSMVCFTLIFGCSSLLFADPPTASYIFPAGGQRATNVSARIGGCNLFDAPRLIWLGEGVATPAKLTPIEAIWFEGPVIPQPASQRNEDYPRDFSAALVLAPTAPLGLQTWRLATSQGVTSAWGFVVGEFPEVIEDEVDGQSPAVRVELPVTINGRIFPREDVDAWSFVAKAGQTLTCHVATSVFGSPLDARLEVRDSAGRILGERLPEGSATPALRFTAPADGEYQVRIHDTAFGGLQDHVYRLTVTAGPSLDAVYPLGGRRGAKTRLELSGVNLPQPAVEITLPDEGAEFVWRLDDAKSSWGEVRLDLDDFDELLEVEPNDMAPQSCSVPGVLNGRIQLPGDVDVWRFAAKKGIEYQFEARAARLGSPLDAVLEVHDADGKRLAEADDLGNGQTDARLRFTAPADAEYRLSVRDRLASRGDARFAYRIRATSIEQPEFALSLAVDSTNLERGKTGNVKLSLDRGPGFKEPVTVEAEGLPPGVTLASPAVIAANQKDVQLQFKTEAAARITAVPLKIIGRTKVGDREFFRRARAIDLPPPQGSTSPPVASDSFWLAVVPPTPFKFVGIFETKFIPRGAVFVRKYRVERNGFEGPLEVQLADRQGRHLQGVRASPVVIPAGQSDFEFAVVLPPWMEIGRTCRSTLSVSGIVTDPDGSPQKVSYSSNDQNNQMIALVDPGRLAMQLPRTTFATAPGHRLELPLRLQRDRGLTNSVTIELVLPKGCRGVTASPLEIAGDQNSGTLLVELANAASGLDLRSLTIRATTRDERGLPVTAETPLVLVSSR